MSYQTNEIFIMEHSEILAETSVSITNLKKDPVKAVHSGGGLPVVVLNHNKPAFYCLLPEAYEIILDKLDDLELAKIIGERLDGDMIKVDVNEL